MLSGDREDVINEARAQAYDRLMRSRDSSRIRLWWARRSRCVGSAMVVENEGRAGMLICTPAEAPGVDRGALGQLVRDIADDAIAGGLTMVQALLAPEARAEIALLDEAGYQLLARLIYLRHELVQLPRLPGQGEAIRFEPYERFGDEALLELIPRTYVDTMDCPDLVDIRRPADVLEAHKASGVFTPRWWWLALRGGAPAGCVLVNECGPSRGEVVYLGVVPEHRGQGVAGALMAQAMHQLAGEGVSLMTLAVDESNAPARRLYERLGFVGTQRKQAWARLCNPSPTSDLGEL
jgi:GNAT superfamily N-acetyltransferase